MFADKVVIVTGAAGALGRAVFEYFAEGGARVVALDYSSKLLDLTFSEKDPDASRKFLGCRESAQEHFRVYNHIFGLPKIEQKNPENFDLFSCSMTFFACSAVRNLSFKSPCSNATSV